MSAEISTTTASSTHVVPVPRQRRRRTRTRYWLGPAAKGPSIAWAALVSALTITPLVMVFLAVYWE